MSPRAISVALAVCAMAATASGGLFAMRFRGRLQLLMGFAAGVLIGLVCFDLLPEIVARIHEDGFNPRVVTGALAAGFLFFHVLEKSILIHHHDECEHYGHKHPRVGVLSSLALAGHSFMDGLSIGFGFQASWKIGLVIGLAVVAHDFVDGMNTVVLMLGNKNTAEQAKPYLVLDAAAPVLGLVSTFFFQLPAKALVLYLGFFAGFLLYIGASHILPEAHSERASKAVVALTLLGALFALGVSALV